MTEAEWLACRKRPDMMLSALREGTGRKLRLFVCAAGRHLWDHLRPQEQDAIELGERAADGDASPADLAARLAALSSREASGPGHVARCAVDAVPGPAAYHVTRFGYYTAARHASWPEPWPTWKQTLCHLIRDLFGDQPTPAPRRTCSPPLPFSLAVATYDERSLPSGHLDPARLAVLSDALEEAGWADEAILAHLRSPGPHVRGCWALDLVLARG